MNGKTLIHSLKLQNFLSYGTEGQTIQLQPLNVIIGPNTSGKSNLIEALGLLQATPTDLTAPIREGGGVNEWLWKGEKETPTALIESIIDYPEGVMPLRYQLCFTRSGQRLEVVDEVIENQQKSFETADDVYFFYRYQNGRPALNVRTELENKAGSNKGRNQRYLRKEEVNPQQSVLSQKKDRDYYPEITYLNEQFSNIRIYRDWNLGRYTPPRMPQPSDLSNDFLLEDYSNLGHVLNNLDYRGVKNIILAKLQKFDAEVEDIFFNIEGATVQVFLRERNLLQPIPATRLSDGTLHYLCLLTLLCHPNPPPLICIEEPEIGLHPDILQIIAELLIEASQRTQLIVTTHSDALVSGLTEVPESVLVCEKNKTGSYLRRLDQKRLKKWLEDYTLGDLWRMGELGGNRW